MTGDGFEPRGLVSGTQRLSGDQQDARRFAHNPEVAGSNPSPATRPDAPSDHGRGFCLLAVHGFVHGGSRGSVLVRPVALVLVISAEASAPPMISSASVFATWRSASRSVCTYCFMVNATSACPMGWLSAFQSIFAFRPAVA